MRQWLDVPRKGFLSIYGLTILPLVLCVTSIMIFNMQYQWKAINMNQKLHMCEIYAINKVKNELLNYEESNKTISFYGYDIDLIYDDITAYITIRKKEKIHLYSKLIWDDIENVVVDYTYLEK